MSKVRFAPQPEIRFYNIDKESDWEKWNNKILQKTIILDRRDFDTPYSQMLWTKILPNNPPNYSLTSREKAIEFFVNIIDIITNEYLAYPYARLPSPIKYSTIYAAAAYFLQVKCNINVGLNSKDIEYAKDISGAVGFGTPYEKPLTIKELYLEIDMTFP